jgi:hypothetical protein
MLHVPSPLSHEQFQVVSIPSRSPRLIIAVDPSTRTLVLGGSFIVLNFNFSSKAPMGDGAKRTKAMSPRYWEFLALATGVFCVVTEWGHAKDRPAHFRLLWTQALHWVAILVTMNIVLLSGVRQMLPAPAISLVLLTLLALGTFLAGVNFLSLRISFLGLALALAVPAIAWFTKSALFLVLAAIFVIGLGLALWPRLTYKRAADEP